MLILASANAWSKTAKTRKCSGTQHRVLANVSQSTALKDKSSSMMTVSAIALKLKKPIANAMSILIAKLVNASACPSHVVMAFILIQETVNAVAKSR